ncbi:MAG: tetratricopeptide repeat protein [Bacteroidota bacterium]
MQQFGGRTSFSKIVVFIFCLIAFMPLMLVAQTGRGIIVNKDKEKSGFTRAVVVGVSEYPNLPENRQLQFADDDALLFYALLKRLYPAKDNENIRLILNAEASAVQIKETISELIDESSGGDRLIIYFAGHGDVFSDSAKRIDDAFLLCHGASTDADYSISDAVSMMDLHKLIASGLEKNISVLLVTDACRSGKYATSQTGAYATARVLSEKWDKISRIASCQANESSYEDPQWGGGHGAFTYFLIDGMAGAADEMGDSLVDFSELEFYVKKSVRMATAKKQNPVFLGDANTEISSVSGEKFDKQMNVESLLASRATGNPVFSADTAVNKIILAFMSCLHSDRLLEPADACAYSYYKDLQNSQADKKTIRKAKGSLFVALDNSAQKVLDIYLSGSGNMPPAAQFEKAAREIGVARELFITKTALIKTMLPKKLFLEAMAIIRAENRPEYKTAEKKLKKSNKLDKNAAYSYNALGKLYLLNGHYAVAETSLKKAIERAPRWTYPKSNLGLVYSSRRMWAQSENIFRGLVLSDSTFSWGYNNLGCLYFDQGKYENCRLLWQKAIRLQPGDPVPVMNLGTLAKDQGRLADAKKYFMEAKIMDTLYADVNIKLGDYYSTFIDSLKVAENYYLKAISLEPFFAEYYNSLGNFYKGFDVTLPVYHLSEALFRKAIELDPYNEDAYYNLSSYYLSTGDIAASEKIMKQCMSKCKGSARSLYLMGINSWNRKEYTGAEKIFKTSIEKDPLFLSSYLKLGEFYEQLNRPADAEKLYRDAAFIFPDSPLLYYRLANFYFRQNTTDSAIRWYRKSIEVDSFYSYGYSSLAYIFLKQGNFQSAKQYFLEAQQLNPYKHKSVEFAYLLKSRADSLALDALSDQTASGKQKLKTVVNAYNTALELDPGNVNTAIGIAHVYYLTDKPEDAMKYIEPLQSSGTLSLLIKESVNALYARILLDLNKPAEAINIYDVLMANDPFPSYLGKALALYQQGNTDAAILLFKKEKIENPQYLNQTWLKTMYSPKTLKLIESLSQLCNK